jgi:hypothetical protein
VSRQSSLARAAHQSSPTRETEIFSASLKMIVEAFLTSAGMPWKSLLALVLGYLISADIQVLVAHRQMAAARIGNSNHLPGPLGPRLPASDAHA